MFLTYSTNQVCHLVSRKNYINNLNPTFNPPKNEIKRSAFICYAIKKTLEIDVARSHLNHTLLPIDPKTGNILPRFRRLNEHRACAMRAMVPAMLYYFNINSNLVEASIEKLSDECGLSTISNSGNKSITRASRLINQFLEPMGFIKCKKTLNQSISNYTSKKISLTPIFFMLLNISESIINSYLSKSFNLCKKFEEKEKEKNLFNFSLNVKIISKLDEKSARKTILNALINHYTASELTQLGAKGLKKKIDIEYSNICRLYKK